MKYVLGLTGPTGAGKSTVAGVAKELGWYVIDCDKTVREAYKREEVRKALISVFGADVVKNGLLDRKTLAARAFATKESTELLNKTVLPFIIEMVNEEIAACGADKILLDAPTLYESGADGICNAVCALLSKEENRLGRIIARDGIDEASARLRMSAGKSEEYYKARTGYIIYNDAGEEALKEDFARLLKNLGGN